MRLGRQRACGGLRLIGGQVARRRIDSRRRIGGNGRRQAARMLGVQRGDITVFRLDLGHLAIGQFAGLVCLECVLWPTNNV